MFKLFITNFALMVGQCEFGNKFKKTKQKMSFGD